MRSIFGKARLRRHDRADTFLGRLARDVRGNTMAIMAAALIPFCGLVGGGIDLSRMYITKTRLQHACDAGALAGRKQMGSGTWGADDNTAAQQFFAANFNVAGMYGSAAPTYAFAESAGKVTGTASATLPMTLMRVLGKTEDTLTVTCDAEMRLPNTDVMFVLDTTGSMGDTPVGDTQTKLASLKTSVKCFYEIVARLDTNANCTTGTPSGGTGNQVQIRFGFVPYATNVNVGKLLNPAWFADSRDYQTRQAVYRTQNSSTTTSSDTQPTNGSTNTSSTAWADLTFDFTGLSGGNCPAAPASTSTTSTGNPSNGASSTSGGGNSTTTSYTVSTTTTTTTTEYQYVKRTSIFGPYCQKQRRTTTTTVTATYTHSDTVTTTPTSVFDHWKYAKLPVTVSLLKNGSGWNSSFQWPIATGGTNKTIDWDGCIEERQTVSQASYSPVPSGAKDLDIDSVPVAGDASTQWGMVLPDLIYTRKGNNTSAWTTDTVDPTTDDYPSSIYYACPTEAKLLQSWSDATAFQTYVDSLRAEGNTYHDIGLIWGGRLMSPDGLFAANNRLTPQGGEIDRHMIFMTDGDACTGVNNYTAYGVNWFDRRTTDASVAPTDGCTQTGTLTQQVNARMSAACTAIKNKNITLWVISFGYVDPTTVTRLTACATTSRYYSAVNQATLQSTFQSIANQISQLRLTR